MYFTEEHQMFREGFQRFLAAEVSPHIDRWEQEGEIDKSIWKKMGEQGYFGLNYPEKYGGLNLDIFYTIIFLEELQRINSGGFAAAAWAHVYLAMTHLNHEAPEELKQHYLRKSISGELLGCLCITEPFAGSDVANIRSYARLEGENWIINGSKTFITNGHLSDYLVVAAKTALDKKAKGISIFLVDRNAQGIQSSKLNKLGWRASDTAEIAFQDVKIPKENLLGEENSGFQYLMEHFALERLIMGVNAHARSEAALEYTLQYLSERKAFGKNINEFQAIRHQIAELATEIEIVKQFNYQTAQRLGKGEYVVKEATMSKLKSTQVADEVMYKCLQFLGGYGYMEDYPLARMFRDSRLGPIGGGTSEILKEILAKIIIDKKSYKTS